jgi:hypothetical protein
MINFYATYINNYKSNTYDLISVINVSFAYSELFGFSIRSTNHSDQKSVYLSFLILSRCMVPHSARVRSTSPNVAA